MFPSISKVIECPQSFHIFYPLGWAIAPSTHVPKQVLNIFWQNVTSYIHIFLIYDDINTVNLTFHHILTTVDLFFWDFSPSTGPPQKSQLPHSLVMVEHDKSSLWQQRCTFQQPSIWVDQIHYPLYFCSAHYRYMINQLSEKLQISKHVITWSKNPFFPPVDG
jgi:hypothetical protein